MRSFFFFYLNSLWRTKLKILIFDISLDTLFKLFDLLEERRNLFLLDARYPLEFLLIAVDVNFCLCVVCTLM